MRDWGLALKEIGIMARLVLCLPILAYYWAKGLGRKRPVSPDPFLNPRGW